MVQELLKKLKRDGEEREAQRIAQKFGLKYLDVASTPVNLEAFSLVSEEKARLLKAAPFQLKYKNLSLAVLNPQNSLMKELIKNLENQGFKLELFVVSQSSLEQLLMHYKSVPKETKEITGEVGIEKKRLEELSEKVDTLEEVKKEISDFDFRTFQTSQLLEVILAGALSNRASDIHFEAEEKSARLRFRIDGLLHDVVPELSNEIYEYLVSRIKLLANLQLNVQDRPQDGRFTINLTKKAIECRISTIPSEYGETIVIRILDPDLIQLLNLEQLGFREDDLKIIEQELKKPDGMILNTGPTGSGKTTTLYSFLNYKQNPEIKIITIEDPIEYHLEDIEQTQVDPAAGYTFANGLKSIMRQDPDIILVGEIRDQETANIAVQAALTGHLVFSTVHANSAVGTIPRLLDLKTKVTSIGPALNLVIAQRLVRKLCPACRQAKKISVDFKKKIEKILKSLPKRVKRKDYSDIKIFEAKGCKKCNGLGYRGRIAIFELMKVENNIQNLIDFQTNEIKIQEIALKNGMVTVQQDGILKIISGVTTIEEIERVTGPLVL